MSEQRRCERTREARQHTKYWWSLSCHPEAIAEGSHKMRPRPRISNTRKLVLKFNPAVVGVSPLCEAHRKHLFLPITLFTSKKAAFTLAEVLITLGIIGVVAAMTIPTLIANYKEKALQNQFKKSYAMINQALLSAQSSFGYIPRCYYAYGSASVTTTSECLDLTEKFLSNLKVIRICEDHAYEKGCIPEYKGIDDILKEQHKDDEDYDEEYWQDYATHNCGGFNTSEILNNKKVYILADGTIMFFYRENSSGCLITAIDVNGMKGPNKSGYDLYAVRLSSDGNRFRYESDGCLAAEEGGRSFNQMYNAAFKK